MTTTIGSLDINAFNDLYSDSNQYFWFESDSSATYGAGAHVTLVPDTTFISNPTGQNILMNTDGFSVRNGLLPMMTLDNDSLDFNVVDTTTGTYVTTATFSSTGSQIGQSDGSQSYIYLDYHSLRMIDKEGNTYFHISDLRDKNGRINNEYIGDGATTTFPLFIECFYLYQVMVNDTVVYDRYTHQTSTCSYDNFSFTFLTMTPADGDIIDVSYLPMYPNSAKAYTLGNASSSKIGGYSLREGIGTEASGDASHAEGNRTIASGAFSHAEGGRNKAMGACSHAEGGGYTQTDGVVHTTPNNASGGGSHAEGGGTTASGDFSHSEGNLTKASGKGSHSGGFYTTASGDYSNANGTKTVANYENQFVIGAYNDNKSNNAFEIGNSSSGGFRSNAFEVDWQGNVVASGNITDSSGNAFVSFETGTVTASSVTWKYRKWANGELEMWGRGLTTLNINTAVGNIYTTAGEYDIAVPSFVDSVDFVTGELSGGGWVDVTGFNVPPKIRLYAPTAYTSTNRYLRYYLKGTWS